MPEIDINELNDEREVKRPDEIDLLDKHGMLARLGALKGIADQVIVKIVAVDALLKHMELRNHADQQPDEEGYMDFTGLIDFNKSAYISYVAIFNFASDNLTEYLQEDQPSTDLAQMLTGLAQRFEAEQAAMREDKGD